MFHFIPFSSLNKQENMKPFLSLSFPSHLNHVSFHLIFIPQQTRKHETISFSIILISSQSLSHLLSSFLIEMFGRLAGGLVARSSPKRLIAQQGTPSTRRFLSGTAKTLQKDKPRSFKGAGQELSREYNEKLTEEAATGYQKTFWPTVIVIALTICCVQLKLTKDALQKRVDELNFEVEDLTSQINDLKREHRVAPSPPSPPS